MEQSEGIPEFEYAIEMLPPSRIGRRWRWELWRGASLLAAGWRLSPKGAQQAVRAAALRRVYQSRGVVPLPSALDAPLRSGVLTDVHGLPICALRLRLPADVSRRAAA
jgi:hypothetical protein